MQDVLYIKIGDNIWKLFEDGHLEILAPDETVPEGVVVIQDILPTDLINGALLSSGTSAVTTIFGNVDRTAEEVIPQAGFQTYTEPDTTEELDQPSTLVQRLSSEAAITIELNDDENLEDSYVNRFENPSVDFFGTTFDIDDDWTVELALIDSSGQVFISQSIVVGGVWELLNQDLTPLAEGPFIAAASVIDFYGNRVSSVTTSVKDTLAEGVSVEGDTGSDTIIDMFEAPVAQLSGEFAHVQAGANVDLFVTDIAGTQLKFSTVLNADGTWSLTGDLSSLVEGTLTLDSETIDLAGNPAQISNTVELFLSPRITINNDDSDGIFNQYEAPTEVFYGRTLNVEDGQTVTVTVSSSGGGSPLVLTTTVVNQTWSIDPYDVSSLPDGTLTITADTVNLAGQPAQDQINWRLDQTADIDAQFIDPNTDGVYNALEAMAASVIGNVIDIEDGQPVAIEARDTAGNVIRGTGVVINGSWASIDFDVSAAAPGELSLTILGIDVAGNRVNASATIEYDPVAIIDNIADDPSDADQIFNLDQVTNKITFEGSTDGIETGQPLTITISDGVNPDVVINTVVVQGASGDYSATGTGTWTTADNEVDISSLNDGDLTVTITGADAAGNPAEGTDVIHKDTMATVTVQFDGDGKLSASEITAVSISGATTDIEAGQTVTVTISGGTASDIVFDAIVQANGTYSSLNNATNTTYDLSAFDDGTLTVSVAVEDVAGNPATATNTTLKDVVINIDIDTDTNGLDVAAIKGSTLTDYNGTTDAEDGQVVTLTISDGVNSQSQTAIVSGGLWNISGLVPTGLRAISAWTLKATVDDQAGNTATDSTPTIIEPLSVVLAEANVSFVPDVAVSQILASIDADPAFNSGPYTFSDASRQTELDSLTSSTGTGGDTTTVVVSADGKTIQLIRDSDSVAVIDGVIDDTSGTVTLTLRGSIEQATGMDVIASKILIQTTENDVSGDPKADVVESELRFFVRDTSLEFAVDDSYQVVEDTSSTGNLFANDNLQEGPLTIQSIRFNSTDYSVSASSPAVITDATGTLTVYSSGTWIFEAARNLDNSVTDPTFEFTYVAKDADGDTDTADAVITILDGVAGSVDSQTIDSGEADLDTLPGAGTGGGTTFTISAGSDNMDPATIAFTPLTITLLEEQFLTSLGEALIYEISPDGKTLTATTASGGETVFVFTVSAVLSSNGENLDVTGTGVWSRPLDHDNSAGDLLELPIAYTADDTDGTPIAVTGSATIDFSDGNNPALSITAAVSMDEDDLAPTMAADGTLTLDVGSDFVESLVFKAGSELSGITSQGETINWAISPDGLTMTGSNGFGEVIRVVLDSLTPNLTDQQNFTYTVTQSQAMDQPNTNGGSDGVLSLPFVVVATDSDGDTTEIALDISIADADAGSAENDPALLVSEQPGSGLPAKNSNVLLVNSGADPLVSIDFAIETGDQVMNFSSTATSAVVTQNGVALTWRNNGDGTLEALNANNEVVLRATVPVVLNILANQSDEEIPVAFEVLGPIDHFPDSDASMDDIIPILIPLKIGDSDGTLFDASYEVLISDGQDPVVNPGPTLTVQENDIDTSAAVVAGTIQGSVGSDALDDITFNLDTAGITSGGNAVTISKDSANRWYGVANGENVFQVDIAFDGTVTFTLLKALDHPAPPVGTADNNNLALQFSYSATDADDDVSNTETFTVNVTDDIPEAPVYDENLTFTEYDSFNGNLLTAARASTVGNFGADGGSIVNVTYDSVNYTVPDGGSVVITLNESGFGDYGTLEIFSDGRFTVVTGALNNLDGNPFSDSFSYDMQDADEDVVTVPVTFDLEDRQGSFTLTPLETIEDTPVTLSLIGNTGDQDNGENIVSFVIAEASLQGGTLSLDGVTLTADSSGNIVITDIVLTGSGVPGETTVDGALVFTPALNDSNQTTDWTFDITMNIDTNTDPVVVQKNFDFSVVSDADAPIWEADDGSNYLYQINEDTETTLNPTEASLFDTDGSEVLTYRITAIEAGLVLSSGGASISVGDELTEAEFSALTASADENLSGEFTFTAEAISTEQENSDQESASQVFTVDVAGVADVPTLYVRNVKGTEDQPIDLKDVIQGVLDDTDGSEELWFELTLPDGWSIDAPGLQDLGGGVYRVSDTDIQAGATLVPKEDLSQVTEVPSIAVKAVSIESTVDGVAPDVVEALSPERTFTVTLKGVADKPNITSGNGDWSYDADTGVISSLVTYTEDSLIPPGFGVESEDDDGSEEISLHLSGLPEGSTLYDSSGEEAFLEVFDASDPNNVVYTVTLAQLADLSFKPPQDFSGDVVLNLEQINTEPDGDSAAFDLTIKFTVTPVIDTQDGQVLSDQGVEDQLLRLDLVPDLGDLDGSETITSFSFLSGFQGTLFIDGNQVATGTETFSIDTYAEGDIEGFLASGRMTYLPPEDLAGEFFLDFTYDVTDTNSDPAFDDVRTLTGSLDLTIIAQVEQNQPTTADDTRLEATSSTLVSTGGTPIDLTGEVSFFEEDLDGSETLDYVLLKLPTVDGWYVTAPGGAIHDGQGNWLIQAPVTSNTVMEQNLSILDGVTINNNYAYTGPIEIEARVLDGDGEDADIITATLNVDFQGIPDTIAYNPNTVQIDVTPGVEGEDISFAGHLNTVIRNSGDDAGVDQISIRVTPADMAAAGIAGARITGPGVEVHYDLDGTTVLAWIFDDTALATLGIAGIDEDFSGDIALTIHVVATDPSGDSIEKDQVLNIDVLPVVDDLNPVAPFTGNEDQLFNLGFANLNLLGDDDTDPTRGTEEIIQITFTNLSGGTILDPEGVLTDNGDGSFTLVNAADRNKLFYRPPENASINDPDPTSSNITLDVTLTITDTTTGGTTQPNSVTTEKTFTLAVELQPITDPANLTVPTNPIIGDEDSHIDLSALSAELIDQDGSEAMSLQIVGVPAGAVMYSNGVQLPNNGLDESGNGTYSWTVTQAQLANLTIVPATDFAGDITLGLQAVTYEKGTTDFVTTTAEFTVGVNPIADGVQLLNAPATAPTTEGDPVNLNVVAEILEEVNPNETIELTLTALSSSDASALARLARIDVGGTIGIFRDNGNGTSSATVRVDATALAVGAGGIDLYTGELAWGNLDLQLDIHSVDTAIVAGSEVTNISDPVTANLSVSIEPEPDPALLARLYDGIIASNGQDIGLGLTVTPLNPAPGETSQLIIENLPSGFSFNVGSAEGSNWVVDEGDVASLQLQTGTATGDFALNVYTRTTLNGETVTGQQQSIEMKIQAAGDNTLTGTSGNDYYSGAEGADVFVWSYYDQGGSVFPVNDLVADFDRDEGDQLHLDSLLMNDTSTTGSDLDALMDVTESGGNTVFNINVNGDAPGNQIITLESVTKNDLYGGDAFGVSEADFLQKLVDDNIMITV